MFHIAITVLDVNPVEGTDESNVSLAIEFTPGVPFDTIVRMLRFVAAQLEEEGEEGE